jgi:hypothetical protein
VASLEIRLAAIERRFQMHPAKLVIVEGAVPGEPQVAASGEHRWNRAPGEPIEVFEARVLASAAASGLPFVILGGVGAIGRVDPLTFQPTDQHID